MSQSLRKNTLIQKFKSNMPDKPTTLSTLS